MLDQLSVPKAEGDHEDGTIPEAARVFEEVLVLLWIRLIGIGIIDHDGLDTNKANV